MTKEYLKMADVFIEPLRVREKSPRLLDCCGALAANFLNEPGAKYAAHAINSHDELVAEVERLRVVVDGVISAAKSMQDRKPLTPWGDGFKECAVSIERAISGVMSGELSVFPRDL